MDKRIFHSILLFTSLGCYVNTSHGQVDSQKKGIDQKIERLLAKMTLEEKIGQMNQYNGFWDATGPAPKEGSASLKYHHLKSGLIGSMLNVTGAANVRKWQELAENGSRLGIHTDDHGLRRHPRIQNDKPYSFG